MFLSILFWRQNNGVENNFVTETYSLKSDSSEVKKCTDCHAVLFEKKRKHVMSEEKGCEDCHQSNGNEHPKTDVIAFSLVKKVPDLCFTCHDQIKNNIASLPVVHQPVNQGKFCLDCHLPHSSDERKLLIAKNIALCLSCHNKPIITKTRTLTNIDELLKNNKVIHTPIKTSCTACHNPHASANNNLLVNYFPEDEYVMPVSKDSFALCFGCHDSKLLNYDTTTTATNFRNGQKNLHFLHVMSVEKKGKACIFCHNSHASNYEHRIQDKAKFGTWEFKLNYTSNEKGGSCSPACHVNRVYDRVTPFINNR